MSVTKVLQIMAQNRAEICCHQLIDCLLNTYKATEIHDDDTSSNSSVEIYRFAIIIINNPLMHIYNNC